LNGQKWSKRKKSQNEECLARWMSETLAKSRSRQREINQRYKK
jgi:hypothetical protein